MTKLHHSQVLVWSREGNRKWRTPDNWGLLTRKFGEDIPNRAEGEACCRIVPPTIPDQVLWEERNCIDTTEMHVTRKSCKNASSAVPWPSWVFLGTVSLAGDPYPPERWEQWSPEGSQMHLSQMETSESEARRTQCCGAKTISDRAQLLTQTVHSLPHKQVD